MITITETDYKLPQILEESKLFNFVSKMSYHAYGLKQEHKCHVLIEYNCDVVNKAFVKRMDALVEFFKLNGIIVDVYSGSDELKVTIGFRRDLRELKNSQGKPIFASSILTTIVYALEDRIHIEQMKTYKVPDMPKFGDS